MAEVESPPTSSRYATANGYGVELLTDDVTSRNQLMFEVRRDGEAVRVLTQCLGALGHLVNPREGDLANLHVHSEETETHNGRIEFGTRFRLSADINSSSGPNSKIS